MMYTSYISRGVAVNADYIYISRALQMFLKVLQQNRPHLVTRDWFLHWDNAPFHNTQLVQEFLAKNHIKLIPPPTLLSWC
jgi:hypothetical protein